MAPFFLIAHLFGKIDRVWPEDFAPKIHIPIDCQQRSCSLQITAGGAPDTDQSIGGDRRDRQPAS